MNIDVRNELFNAGYNCFFLANSIENFMNLFTGVLKIVSAVLGDLN